MKRLIGVMIMICIVAVGPCAANAASVTFEVDTLDQDYDEIRLYMANIPRDFVFTDPPIYTGQATRITVSELTPGQTYKFVAVLKKGEVVSEGSNIVQQLIPIQTTEYAAPTVTATSDGTETVFTFDTPGATPTKYSVRIAEDPAIPAYGGATGSVGTLYEGTANPIRVPGLAQGKKYNFYGAYNVGAAQSPVSATGSITVPSVIQLKAPTILIIEVK